MESIKATTTEHYESIANRFISKGISVDQAYSTMEAGGFAVNFDGIEYTNIYAGRVLAIMHNKADRPKSASI